MLNDNHVNGCLSIFSNFSTKHNKHMNSIYLALELSAFITPHNTSETCTYRNNQTHLLTQCSFWCKRN